MKTLVIIPTFNEITNINKIVNAVLSQSETLDVLVVDDNSPDGTGQAVRDMQKDNSRIHLIEREGKMGLGTAYIAGFNFAIENKFDFIFEMDADFSHNPAEIPNFLESIREYDLVLGSRYIQGVNVVNWPLRRLILSYGANLYTRIITGLSVRDATGGYKCFRREVLEAIDLDKIHSNGYTFQIEMTYKAWKKGFRIKEIPIVFIDRVQGQSKMSRKIIVEAIFMVWKLRFLSLIGKL
ncbi:polyprenol monophosphomannose synthase [candidate division KSB1 bacterium]